MVGSENVYNSVVHPDDADNTPNQYIYKFSYEIIFNTIDSVVEFNTQQGMHRLPHSDSKTERGADVNFTPSKKLRPGISTHIFTG